MAFHPGQLVECINLREWRWTGNGVDCDGPAYGDILTVSGTALDGGVECLRFHEWPGGDELYRANNFRPLSPKRIECFTALLADPPKVSA